MRHRAENFCHVCENLCAICYHFSNFKNVKNTLWIFNIVAANDTKLRKASQIIEIIHK